MVLTKAKISKTQLGVRRVKVNRVSFSSFVIGQTSDPSWRESPCDSPCCICFRQQRKSRSENVSVDRRCRSLILPLVPLILGSRNV